MIRNGRTPTLLLVGLIVIIFIISYNYWSLSQKNVNLREALFLNEEKINDLMEKKAYVEKQLGINSDRIKSFEEKIEANSQALKQKDSEIDELNSKFRSRVQESDKYLLDLNEAKENLNLCNLAKENATIELLTKNNELVLNITKLQEEIGILSRQKNNPTNCDAEIETNLKSFQANLTSLIKSELSELDSKKFASLLDGSVKIEKNQSLDSEPKAQVKTQLPEQNNEVNEKEVLQQPDLKLEEKNQEPRVKRDTELVDSICKLPKVTGECKNSTERYYFDAISERCLLLVYSGCDGNLNNFESLEQCNRMCLDKNQIKSVERLNESILNSTIIIGSTTTSTAKRELLVNNPGKDSNKSELKQNELI